MLTDFKRYNIKIRNSAVVSFEGGTATLKQLKPSGENDWRFLCL